MELFQTALGPFRCFKNDQNFMIHLKAGGFWESELLLIHLPQFYRGVNTILDIGAHIGSHSFAYSFFNKKAKIYAFEPQKEIYKVLVMNMETRPNVIPINKCVGHKMGTANLSKNAKWGENSEMDVSYGNGPVMNLGGVSLGTDGEPVEMITIDSMNLDGCDFIKMDVEGAEGLVIQGAVNTIRKYRPTICFEYSPHLDTKPMAESFGLSEVPDVKKELEKLGYTNFRCLEGENWIAIP